MTIIISNNNCGWDLKQRERERETKKTKEAISITIDIVKVNE